MKQGRDIKAIIRATAVQQDGRTNGITAPNGTSQTRLMNTVIAKAGLTPNDVDIVESHGTGTKLGDRIEVESLTATYANPERARELIVSTAKTYVGHCEEASGLVGLTKACMMFDKRVVPRHINVSKISDDIDLSEVPLKLSLEDESPMPQAASILCINNYGFTGTIASAVIERPPVKQRGDGFGSASHVLTLSAKSPFALRSLAVKYAKHLDTTTSEISDICFTSNVCREIFDYRVAVHCQNVVDASRRLSQAVV